MNGWDHALFAALLFTFAWSGVVFALAMTLHRITRLGELWPGYWLLALAMIVVPLAVPPLCELFSVDSLEGGSIIGGITVPLSAISSTLPVPETAGIPSWITLVCAAYIAGVLVKLVGLLHGRHRLQALLAGTRPLANPELHGTLIESIRRMEPKRNITLRVTPQRTSPFACGWLQPVIVLPAHLLETLSRAQLAMIVAHEAAHVRRDDAVAIFVLGLVRAIFWCNPFALALTRRARLAMELASDALALQSIPAARRDYARTLLDVLCAGSEDQTAPGAVSLVRMSESARIKALLTRRDLSQPVLVRKLAVLAVAAMLIPPAAGAAAIVVTNPATNAAGIQVIDGRITSAFGQRIFGENLEHHDGTDVAAPAGTPIYAPLPGHVLEATNLYEPDQGMGKVVIVEFANGVVTLFAHLDSYAVDAGDTFNAGSVIGRVGVTGRTTGPHLHLETRVAGKRVDPETVFDF